MTNRMWMQACATLASMALLAGCGDAAAGETDARVAARQAGASALSPNERVMYEDLAKQSWRYLDRYYQPATGFVNGTPDWFNTTLWDIGGQLLAYVAAKDLGLLPEAEFEKRVRTALTTLERVPLFENAAYNRIYSTKDGSASDLGPGWSATDLGRFLVALKVLSAREPEFAALAERVVRRNDFSKVVKNGYLHGRARSNGRTTEFQEGRIGYEQYVAAGFAAWGADVGPALNVATNARPVQVHGVPLLADKRGFDRLLSEPFILYGLELGLEGPYRELAANVLKAQEARYRESGQVTIVTEDAVPVKPHYFYYYCVYCNGKPFVVGVSSPRQTLDEPRWVSTKGAFGWHALFPSDYTTTAVNHVRAALDEQKGWATGVFEKTGKSTGTYDVTSAAVLLEIAAYQLRGRIPLIRPALASR